MSVELFGINIDDFNFEQAVNKAKDLIAQNQVSQVITINPEIIERALKEPNYFEILKNAEMIIPDGIGIKIALKINGHNVSRIAGIDFAKVLLEDAAKANTPVAIIGAKEEVLVKAIENLKLELPNLNLVYSHNGYFNKFEEIYEELARTAPRLVLVAMGAPKQEEFIFGAKKVLKQGLMIGIGGSLDVWSGNVKRAPKIFQALGLEWLYRTVSQPERFKRIFPALPLFILKALKYKIKK